MQHVNGLEEARRALHAGATALVSPPFAACHAGIGYYEAMLTALMAEFPDQQFTFTLCCGDDPAIAHEALRRGFLSIRCAVDGPVQEKLQALADGLGAKLYDFR